MFINLYLDKEVKFCFRFEVLSNSIFRLFIREFFCDEGGLYVFVQKMKNVIKEND